MRIETVAVLGIGPLDGIPCTSVARTLLDFAAVVPVWELRKAVAEAEVSGSSTAQLYAS